MDARDVEWLYEIGTLRHVPRNWAQFGGLDFANVAEHTLRVALTAMAIAADEGADPARAALLALVHDLPETRTGDRNYVQREYTTQHPDAAMAEQLSGTVVQSFIGSLWDEWTGGSTAEAAAAHDADVIDCDLELHERAEAGASIADYLEATRSAARRTLRTTAGRRLHSLLVRRSSHDWHVRGRNRLTSGDWAEGEEG